MRLRLEVEAAACQKRGKFPHTGKNAEQQTLAGWLAGWLTGWQADWHWLASRLADWLAGWKAGWQKRGEFEPKQAPFPLPPSPWPQHVKNIKIFKLLNV